MSSLRSMKKQSVPINNEKKEENKKHMILMEKGEEVGKCAFCLKGQRGEGGKIKNNITNSNKGIKRNNGKEENVDNEDNEKEEEEEEEDENGEKKAPVLITNVPNKKYSISENFPSFYHFSGCSHIICIKCIARIIFTSNLNILPASSSLTFSCNCNFGTLTLDIEQIFQLSNKINQPTPDKICEKHGLILYQYCLDCKKSLCKKCDESHSDLFNNLHHIVKEEPPNVSICPTHPNCFLDMLCKDCKTQICHLCILEGNKHFLHNSISFDNLKSRIITNASSMKCANFEEFEKLITECDNNYNSKHNEEVTEFNKKIDHIINQITQYKKEFNDNMNLKLQEKNTVIEIVKNLYKFFYSEYSQVEKSLDYPVLCMYQVINSELIAFSFSTPSISETYLSTIEKEISQIEISPLFKTKYQFSLKNFKSKKKLAHHNGPINSLCCLKDGRLVSASEDKTVIIWDRELTKPLHIIKDNVTSIKVVKVLNDNRLICGGFKELKIYNDKFKCVNTLKETSNNVSDIIQLDDGRIICGSYREMRIFNVTWNNTYKDSKPVKDHSSWVKSIIKLKNKLFASAGDDHQIFIYDYTIKCIRQIRLESEIHSLCLVEDNDIIDLINSFYIGDNKGRILNYNYENDKFEIVCDIEQHHNKINAIIQLSGGNYASCSQDGSVIIRDNLFNPMQYISKSGAQSINAIAQIPGGQVIMGGEDNLLSIFE